jgi:hypothetical protein
MKRFLAIVFSAIAISCLIGCASTRLGSGQGQSAGLVIKIVVHPEQIHSLRMMPATLVLSNAGFEVIRISEEYPPMRRLWYGNQYDLKWWPGYTSMGPELMPEEFKKKSKTLLPSQMAEWPFEIYVGTNRELVITGHYNTSDSFPDAVALCKEAGLWIGRVDTKPLVVRFDK